MAGNDKNIPLQDRFENFEKLILTHHSRFEGLEERGLKNEEFLANLQKKIRSLNESIDALSESVQNGGGSGGVGAVSEDDVATSVKNILTEDPDVVELIAKVAKNAAAGAVFKQEISAHHEKLSKKKTGWPKIFIVATVVIFLGVGGFYLRNYFSKQTVTIPANAAFFIAESGQEVAFEVAYTASGKVRNNRLYFTLDGVQYFFPLSQ